MAHISKKKLPENIAKALRSKLVDMIRLIGKDHGMKHSIRELLTPTEGVMLSKRLAAIYLVYKDKSILNICETLNMSTSTVLRIQKIYDRGGYQNLRKAFRKLEPTLLEAIEMLLSAGMPPIVGKGRWKGFFDED